MTKDPARPILGAALALLGLGVVLLVAPFALGWDAALQSVGKGVRIAVPYILLLGLGLLVLSVVLRPRPDENAPRPHEPTLFGKDTTDFASQLDRGISDDPTLPALRSQRPRARETQPDSTQG